MQLDPNIRITLDTTLVSNTLDQDGFTKLQSPATNACREDRNVITFANMADFRKNMVRRVRGVLGFRGYKGHETVLIDGNALLHAERILAHKLIDIQVTEERMAELAKHIASETQYWGCPFGVRYGADEPFLPYVGIPFSKTHIPKA